MNYKNIYDQLISKRQANVLVKSRKQYCETHHIIPKSLGGSNNKSNLINLTAKEHYIAHLLLWKYYKSTNDKNAEIKMLYALHRLITGNIEFKQNIKINMFSSKRYEIIKLQFSKMQSSKFKNTKRFHNGNKIISVKIENIDKLSSEWIPGHGIQTTGLKDYKAIRNINTNEVRYIKNTEILPKGWIYAGKCGTTNNTRWITNGIINKKVKANTILPNGFRYGRILDTKFKQYSNGKTNGTKNLKLITNIKTNKHLYVKKEDLSLYVYENSDWICGYAKKRIFSEEARKNIIYGKLVHIYPDLQLNAHFNIDQYMSIKTKRLRQKYIKDILSVAHSTKYEDR